MIKTIWDLFYITFCNRDAEVHPRNIRSRQEDHWKKWLDSNVGEGRHIPLSIISPPSRLTHFKGINMFQEITWITSFQLAHSFDTRTKVVLVCPVEAGGSDDASLRASDCKFDDLQFENKYFLHGFAWITVYHKKTTEVRKFTEACLEAIIKASIITNSVVPHITSHFRNFEWFLKQPLHVTWTPSTLSWRPLTDNLTAGVKIKLFVLIVFFIVDWISGGCVLNP